jgi:hypothetical protein
LSNQTFQVFLLNLILLNQGGESAQSVPLIPRQSGPHIPQ